MKFVILISVLVVLLVHFCSSVHGLSCDGYGEEYNPCGTACPPTCREPETRPCTLQCAEGCFCRKGLLRDEQTGLCVRRRQCTILPINAQQPPSSYVPGGEIGSASRSSDD